MKQGIIVGGANGIGRAIVEACLKRGLRLVVPTLNPPEQNASSNITWLKCDVRDSKQIEESASKAVETLEGKIDFLVYNSGTGVFKPLYHIEPEEWHEVMSVNLTGAFLWLRLIIPYMLKRKAGSIILIGSIAGKVGFASGTLYCASKFGLRGLALALRDELREYNIKVTYIAPGSVATNFFRHWEGMEPQDWMLKPEDVAQAVLYVLDTGPTALPSEIELRPLNPSRARG